MDTVAAAVEPRRSLWSSLVEAVRGSHQDYTDGDLNRAILLLAVPMVLEMVLESLFAVVDVFFVGRLGADAVATVGLTESMLSLVFAVGMGLSLSTTAMVARRIGEKDPEGAADAAVQAIFLGLLISLAIGLPCLLFAPNLLRLMGATPQIVAVGSGYTRICLGGSCAVLLLFLNNAIFRGAGDAAIAMRLLWVSNIINLFLDPCLIFGLGPFPKLGVTGAALATFTGRSIGVMYQFYRLFKGTERIRVLARQAHVHFSVLWRLVRVSLTGILSKEVRTSNESSWSRPLIVRVALADLPISAADRTALASVPCARATMGIAAVETLPARKDLRFGLERRRPPGGGSKDDGSFGWDTDAVPRCAHRFRVHAFWAGGSQA